MIRLAVMMDKERIIGASTEEAHKKRFELLPKELPKAMGNLYQGENIAGGVSSWKMPTSQAKKNRYAITRDDAFDVEGENIHIITDAQQLVDQYKDSSDELLIVGGKAMFDFFAPHAKQLDIAESYELVPGDVKFDSWESLGFELNNRENWDGFDVLTYTK